MQDTENSVSQMQSVLTRQQRAFQAEAMAPANVRIDRLRQLHALLYENRQKIIQAVNADFGGRSQTHTLMTDIFGTLEAYDHAVHNLKSWMKAEKRSAGGLMGLMGARARVEYQPKGVVGVMGAWNVPVNSVMSPLAAVIAAGNRAMLKFSEVTPETAALMVELVTEHFDTSDIAAFTGGPEIGGQFAALPLDHIVFTGASSIGKHVMRAAAENLTPVTLELGGKSPVIVTVNANLEDAAEKIFIGKTLNGGQLCLAPDYVFVAEQNLQQFVDKLAATSQQCYPKGLTPVDSTAIVNQRHYERLCNYLEDAQSKSADIRPLMPETGKNSGYRLPYQVVVNPSDDMLIMQEEIFGPIFCIKTYQSLHECVDYINAHPRPLGLYLFSRDESECQQIIDATRSGGVTINDVLAHGGSEELPFGGIGNSGTGCYHGLDGFREFSHARSIYTQTRFNLQKMGGLVPPYGEKAEKTLASMIKPMR